MIDPTDDELLGRFECLHRICETGRVAASHQARSRSPDPRTPGQRAGAPWCVYRFPDRPIATSHAVVPLPRTLATHERRLISAVVRPAAHTGMMMAAIGFIVRSRADLGGAVEVVPTIDGVELLDLRHGFEQQSSMETIETSYGGLIPSFYRFGPMAQYFLNNDHRVPLLGCECGEWGCWPLLATVEDRGDKVSWSDFEQPHRLERDYSSFGPFTFSRSPYVEALIGLDRELPVRDE